MQYLDFTNTTSRAWERLVEYLKEIEGNKLPAEVMQAFTKLESQDLEERKLATQILSKFQHPEMHNVWLNAFHSSKRTDVRQAAVFALGKIRDISDLGELINATNDTDGEVRRAARTTETERLAMELALCVEAVDKIEQLWDMSNDEDRQGLVRSLFTEIIYDLDTQRIVNFKLKPWADRFLALRAALYENEASTEGSTALAQAMGNDMLHTGFDISSVYRAIIMVDVEWVVNRLLERLYIHNPQPIHPRSDKTKKLIERNNTIKTRHAAGESVQSLATEYGISEQRIH